MRSLSKDTLVVQTQNRTRNSHEQQNNYIDNFFGTERQYRDPNLTGGNKSIVKIFNLSKRKLSPEELSILSKDLKFTPTPEKQNFQEIKTVINEIIRKLKYKEYFMTMTMKTLTF